MGADERVRYCSQCNLNVYNLSAMSSLEAEQLIAERQENVCVFFYRRKDGSIFTRGCPGKMRVVMRRTSHIAGIALSAVMSVSPLAAQSTMAREAQVVRTESGLELTVVDPQGAICPGAKVDFTGNDFHLERVTDAAGLLRLLLPPGTYTLNISCYGFKPYQKTVVVEAEMSAETKAALEAALRRERRSWLKHHPFQLFRTNIRIGSIPCRSRQSQGSSKECGGSYRIQCHHEPRRAECRGWRRSSEQAGVGRLVFELARLIHDPQMIAAAVRLEAERIVDRRRHAIHQTIVILVYTAGGGVPT